MSPPRGLESTATESATGATWRPWRLRTIAFSLAAAIGMWELGLTRLASLLWFHELAYVIVALALVAMAVGASGASFLLRRGGDLRRPAGALLLALPSTIAACTVALLHSDLAWLLGLFALPFMALGALTPMLYRLARHDRPAGVYAAELLGAVAGLALLGPLALASWGETGTGLLAAVVAVAPMVLAGRSGGPNWRLGLAALGPLLLLAALRGSGPAWLQAPMLGEVGLASHMTGLVEREGLRWHQTRWSAWARTDLLETQATDAAYAFTDAMFVARSVTWDGHSRRFASPRMEAMASLQRLPWVIASRPRVLVLGGGAGFGAAVALQEGSTAIRVVEVNPDTVAFARARAGDNGAIYQRPEVRVSVAEARRFVGTDPEQYDLITLSLMETSPALQRGRSHVHARLLTVEAIADYMARLRQGGVVAIVHNTSELADRTWATAAAALRGVGKDPSGHLSVWRLAAGPQDNAFSHLLLVAAQPWSAQELARLGQSAAELGASTLPAPTAGHRPVTDQRPFLYATGRSLPLQVGCAAMAMLLALGLALRRRGRPGRPALPHLSLALCGAAAALVQVAAIYHAQIAIGAPALAMGAALAGLLGGAGAAAAAWSALPRWAQRPRAVCLLAAGAAGLLTLFAHIWSEALALLSLTGAVTGTVLILAGHGAALGLPFVALLRQASAAREDGEALAVGQDALGAMAGTSAALVLAQLLGYPLVFAAAVAALLVAASTAPSGSKRAPLG